MRLSFFVAVMALAVPALAQDACNCHGYAGPGGPCYSGPGGAAYDGPGGPAYSGPGGPCCAGPGGPRYGGPGGQAYSGPVPASMAPAVPPSTAPAATRIPVRAAHVMRVLVGLVTLDQEAPASIARTYAAK
jgi:hypothetical protein